MEEPAFFTTDAIRNFRTKLRRWYTKHKRELLWRNTDDPYRIWLSEIMLQQTTVATVTPYFERFLERFPNVKELAEADESEVLRAWEGLGYYSRARNIHKTARIITSDYNGTFPRQPEELQKLPGIGRYTAGAIVSFAFNKPAPIVEANTQRLYARLAGFEHELTNAVGQKFLWRFAEELLPSREPGAFNQSLMELGSQVCSPANPACDCCPVVEFCEAHRTDRVTQIPKPKRKPIITEVTHVCVAVEKRKKFLLHQYQPGERWAGLWDFPRWEVDQEAAKTSLNNLTPLSRVKKNDGGTLFDPRELHEIAFAWLEKEFHSQFGLQVNLSNHLATIQHAVTRYKITLICLQSKHVSGRISDTLTNSQWVSPSQFDDFPLSTTARQIATTIQQQKPR